MPALGAAVAAQGGAPDPHWGANTFPPQHPEVRATLSFNRFTEFSKTGTKYNGIDESMGFNMLTLSVADRLPALPDVTFSVWAGGGPTSDQPTRFLQNEYLHNSWGLDRVPVGASRDEVDYYGGGALHWQWRGVGLFEPEVVEGDRWRTRVFAGAGANLGTLYQEPFAQAGFELRIPEWSLKLGLQDRVAFPRPGDAFDNLAHFNNIVQAYVGYEPRRIESSSTVWQWLGNPEVGLTFTYDSGFFVDFDDEPIGTRFISARFAWATGLTFEIWNDILNSTDYGPTMGLMLSFDLNTLSEQLRRWW